MTVPEAAYLAGLIDGEGTIRVLDRRADRPSSSRPTVGITIAGTCTPMHDWIIRVTGVGATLLGGPPPGTLHHAGWQTNHQCYVWSVHSTAAFKVLEQTAPYMIEKRERAELALKSRADYLALDEYLRRTA